MWYKFYQPEGIASDTWDICIHQHSREDDILLDENFRGWHCIRHPMALIYSATLYLEKCREPWVDVPLSRFDSNVFWSATDGALYNLIKDPNVEITKKCDIMNSSYGNAVGERRVLFDSGHELKNATYRQYICGLDRIEDKILFEMQAYSQGVIREMLNFPNDSRFFNVRLEDASFDPRMSQLYEVFKYLGFQGEELIICLETAKEFCLWARPKNNIPKHSTTGMSNEWRQYFKGEVLQEYRRLFGWAEEALGYDSD